jgi:hypothetical protein
MVPPRGPRSHAPRGSRGVAPGIGALLLALAAPASAQQDPCVPGGGLSTCINADNLWPAAGAGPWLSIAPTSMTPAGAVSFGLVLTVLSRPIVLRVASPDPEGTDVHAVDNRLGATFQSTLGLGEGLHLTLSMPVVLFQDGATVSDVLGTSDHLPRSAVGDLRFGVSTRLLERPEGEDGVALAGRFEMSVPSGDRQAFVTSGSPVYVPGASLDHRIGIFRWGADLSGRITEPQELAGAKLGSQIGLSLGASVDILEEGWLSGGLETFGLFTLEEQSRLIWDERLLEHRREPTGSPHIPAEWLLSARSAGLLDGQLVTTLAGGGSLPTGSDSALTVPRFRFALSLQYVPAAPKP